MTTIIGITIFVALVVLTFRLISGSLLWSRRRTIAVVMGLFFTTYFMVDAWWCWWDAAAIGLGFIIWIGVHTLGCMTGAKQEEEEES